MKRNSTTPILWFEINLYICTLKFIIVEISFGEMAERFNAAVLKTVDGVTRPGVRIPVSPLKASVL